MKGTVILFQLELASMLWVESEFHKREARGWEKGHRMAGAPGLNTNNLTVRT